MTFVVKHSRGEKKEERKINGFRKKLMIPDQKCSQHKVKSNIGNIFCVKIYKIDPYFYEHSKELIKVDNNKRDYMLFKIDVYFHEHNLATEIDGKAHTDRDLIFGRKDKKHQKKNLIVNLLELIQVKKAMMQVMKFVEHKHLLVNVKTGNKENQKRNQAKK